MDAPLRRWMNAVARPVVTSLLRSPLHRLLSGSLLLLTVHGRRTGRSYTLPVSYSRSDDELRIVSTPDRTWWRNLRGGATVDVWLAGHERRGMAEIVPAAQPGLVAIRVRLAS